MYMSNTEIEISRKEMRQYLDSVKKIIRNIKRNYGFVINRDIYVTQWRDTDLPVLIRKLKKERAIDRFLNLDFDRQEDIVLYGRNQELFDDLLPYYEFLTSLERYDDY